METTHKFKLAIGGDYIPLKLTRKLWLIDLKLDKQSFGPFIYQDPETNMSPIDMIFQHRCAKAMLILFYGEVGKTNIIAHGIYELFLLCMRADYEILDKNLYDRGLMSIFMPTYPDEDFIQKKLHKVIPRFVEFYKDILGAKDKNGESLIALFDTDDNHLYRLHYREFYYINVRLALVMVKMESLKFDYEYFELIFSMPGDSRFLSSSESKKFLEDLWKKFDFETDKEQDMIFKLLPLFRLNLDFINEEDIDPDFLDSILSNPKMSFRILKFLGISLKGRSRLARTLRLHFYKLKERHEQKYGMYYWYDDAVKRLHDFMKQEFDGQRWLEFMQDLRQDQLNDEK